MTSPDAIDVAIAAIRSRDDARAMHAEIERQLAARLQARPVIFSIELAEQLGIGDRLTNRTDSPPTGVALVTEAELLGFGAARVAWNEPDERGIYTPTLYAWTAAER